MKKFAVLAATSLTLLGFSAQAGLSIITMPLTAIKSHVSKYSSVGTFEASGVLVKTDDGSNDCFVMNEVVHAYGFANTGFMDYLKSLNSSNDQYLLSCYTEGGTVTQIVVTKSLGH